MSSEAIAWAFKQPVSDPTAKLLLIGMGDCADIHHNVAPDPHRYLAGVHPGTTAVDADAALAVLFAHGLLVHAIDELGDARLHLNVPSRKARS